MTSTSLFARATVLPARRAASVGASPAVPVVATTTRSTSACAAISSISAHLAETRPRRYSPSRSQREKRGGDSRGCSSRRGPVRAAGRSGGLAVKKGRGGGGGGSLGHGPSQVYPCQIEVY